MICFFFDLNNSLQIPIAILLLSTGSGEKMVNLVVLPSNTIPAIFVPSGTTGGTSAELWCWMLKQIVIPMISERRSRVNSEDQILVNGHISIETPGEKIFELCASNNIDLVVLPPPASVIIFHCPLFFSLFLSLLFSFHTLFVLELIFFFLFIQNLLF
jgi:hypothetical protein